MSKDFVDFISNFEREHQDTFLLVRRSVDRMEQHFQASSRNFSSLNSIEDYTVKENPPVKSLSSISMSETGKVSRTTAASSNYAESFHEEPILGSLDNLTESKVLPSQPTISTLPMISENLPTDIRKNLKNITFFELTLSKETQSEKRELPQPTPRPSNHVHFRQERMPFFALNIKTINVKESLIGADDRGKVHSPVVQVKSPIDGATILETSSDSLCSPFAGSRPTPSCFHPKKALHLDLDEQFLEEEFLKAIRRIQKSSTSRREVFKEIIEHIFSNKNFQEDAHKNYPRKEVIYCTNVSARELLKRMKNLLNSLGAEDVTVQMKIVNEKGCLETQFQKFLRNLGITADFINHLKQMMPIDEAEIATIQEKIKKISTQLPSRSKSKEPLRKCLFYFQKLIERFPPSHANWNDRAPIDTSIGIKFITVRKLVEKATEVVDTLIAEKLKQITILTYDHFIKPLTLLLLLTKRYFTPRPFMMTFEEYNFFKAHHSCTRRKRIIELLAFWVEHRPSDFTTNSDLLGFLMIFLESIFKYDKEAASQQDFLKLYTVAEDLIDKSNKKGKKDLIRPSTRKVERIQTTNIGYFQPKVVELVVNRHTYDTPGSTERKDTKSSERVCDPKDNCIEECDSGASLSIRKPSTSFGRRSKSLTLDDQSRILEWDTVEIAQQLTLIDAKMFRKIQIHQLLLKRWTKPDNEDDCRELLEMINRFNSLSFWVQYVIVTASDPEQRDKLFNKFIAIAVECLKLQNFMSSHSIFTAFLRLLNTNVCKISESNEENFKVLEEIFKSPTFFQDMETTYKSVTLPAVPSIPFFTNRFFRLQDNVNFSIKLDQQGKYFKGSQLEQLAEYALLMKKFHGKCYEFSKNIAMHAFLKQEYKMKDDIDLEDSSAEEILRLKILEITENEIKF